MPSPYAPPDVPPSNIWIERTNLNGSILAGVSYGIHFTLYLIAAPLLLRQKNNQRNWGFFIFSTVMFVIGTIFIGANTKVNELSFIDNRNFPGGPTEYLLANYNTPANVLGVATFVVANWLADGLLIYRCLVIYSYNYWVAPIPILMYLGSLAMGAMALFEIWRPQSNLWMTQSMKFTKAYFSLSLSLNIGLTFLISTRLLIYRNYIRRTLGTKHATDYTSIVAMLVESSALYSAFNILFLITYIRNSPVQNLFLPVLGNVQMISPLLIIIRVALGRGWSKETSTVISGTTGIINFRHTEGTNTFSLKQLSTASDADRLNAESSIKAGPGPFIQGD